MRLIPALALALLVGTGSRSADVDGADGVAIEAVVIITGRAEDAERAASDARRIAREVGASPDLVEAFGEHAAFSAGSPDSYAIRFQPAQRRACLVLVRLEDVRAIQEFSPQADFDLLVDMLTAHERRHCRQDIHIDSGTPDLDVLRVEVEADTAALGILSPPGTDTRHDTARQAWLLWRNMDAFMSGKPTHWTVPGLLGMVMSEAAIEQGLALQKRAARIVMGKESDDPESAWAALRSTDMGRFLPTWPELLEATRQTN